jgi:Tfp pilus assembly protein PilX
VIQLNQRNCGRQGAARQGGAVLFIVLMLLVIMSIILAWSVKMSTFETRITANQAFRDQAFNRAESALIQMENCITGASQPSSTDCRNGGVDLTANTSFSGAVPGFLAMSENWLRGLTDYWVGNRNVIFVGEPRHNWAGPAQSTTLPVPGLNALQSPQITVERQTKVEMAGFSRDSGSQGFELGYATPFRVTARSTDAGNATVLLQTSIYVPSALVTTPEP